VFRRFTRPVFHAQAAVIAVRLGTLGADGPTGTFQDENGPVPW
jgi:hypothetical protein